MGTESPPSTEPLPQLNLDALGIVDAIILKPLPTIQLPAIAMQRSGCVGWYSRQPPLAGQHERALCRRTPQLHCCETLQVFDECVPPGACRNVLLSHRRGSTTHARSWCKSGRRSPPGSPPTRRPSTWSHPARWVCRHIQSVASVNDQELGPVHTWCCLRESAAREHCPLCGHPEWLRVSEWRKWSASWPLC